MIPTADALAREFPQLRRSVYLNTAAESLGSLTLRRALAQYSAAKELGAPGRAAFAQAESECKQRIAQLLGGAPDDIALLSSTSETVNTVICGIAWQPGDNIVTTELEFPGIYAALLALARHAGVELRTVRHQNGAIKSGEIARVLDSRTRLVVVSHVSFYSGQKLDLPAIGKDAHRVGALVVADCAQSLGVTEFPAGAVDFAVGCSFKWLLGAHGAAVLYARPDARARVRPPFVGWRSVADFFSVVRDESYALKPDAGRYEIGMPNYEALFALRDALGLLDSIGLPAIARHVLDLTGHAFAGLRTLGIDPLTPDSPERRAGIVAFETPHFGRIGEQLQRAGVEAWCKEGWVRISPHFYNIRVDIDRCLNVLQHTSRA